MEDITIDDFIEDASKILEKYGKIKKITIESETNKTIIERGSNDKHNSISSGPKG